MGLSWPVLVSPDSYIVNQNSFSSINDKDLQYYKNLRNLWVCVTRSDCLHLQTVYTLRSAATSCSSTANVSIIHLTLLIVLVIVSVPYLTLLICLISSSRLAKISSLMIKSSKAYNILFAWNEKNVFRLMKQVIFEASFFLHGKIESVWHLLYLQDAQKWLNQKKM